MSVSQQRPNFLTNKTIHSAVLTPIGSKTFVKKVVPIAVSFILHQRTNFGKDDFLTGTHNGVTYKMFRKTMHSSVFKDVRNWIHGALDALDKNYLREMYLIFCDQEDYNKVLESYKFQFKYMGNDVIPLEPPPTKETVAEATDSLLKAISSLNEHNLLEENKVAIKIALTYYDDVTPADYEPPFYGSAANANEIIQQVSGHSKHYLQLGLFGTGFHVMKCRGKGDIFDINRSNSTLNLLEESVGDVEETNADEEINNKEVGDVLNNCYETGLQISSATVDTPILKETESKIQGLDLNRGSPSVLAEISFDSSISDNSTGKMQCICNIPIEFAHIDLVMCLACTCIQHAACMGYLHVSDVPDDYVCYKCKFRADSSPEGEKRKELTSIYRLVVAFAYLNNKVPQNILDQLEDEKKRLILKKMKSLGVISPKGGQVNIKHIETTCLKGLFQINNITKVKEPDSMTLDDSDKSEENNLRLDSVSCKKRKYM